MTIFTPYQNTPNTPDYSKVKEIDVGRPNQTIGTALEGAGRLFNAGIDAVDELNKSAIDKELRKSIDQERNTSIATGQELLGPNAPTTYGNVNDPVQSNTIGRNPVELNPTIPPQVEQGVRKMNMIAQANRQGKFDDINYYGNMQSIAQGLVSRYPGYTEYIYQKTGNILGVNPVNAQRGAIQASLAQIQAAGTKAADSWTNDVEKWMKYLGPDGTRDALTAGNNPQKQASIRAFVATQMSSEHIQDRAIKDLNHELTAGNVTEQRIESTAKVAASQYFGRAMNAVTTGLNGENVNANQLRQRLSEMRTAGKEIDPKKLQEISLALGELNDKIMSGWDNMVQAPQFKDANGNPASFDSLMRNSAKLRAVRDDYSSVLSSMVKNVGAGRLDLATSQAEFIKLSKENATAAIVAMPAAKTLVGLEGALGQSATTVMNTIHTQANWKGLNEFAATLNRAWATQAATGNAPGGLDTPQAALSTNRPGVPVSPAENRSIVNIAKWGVTQTENKEIAMNWAAKIANNGTTNFILSMNRNQQYDVWATIASQDVSNSIKKLSETRPELWTNYRKWIDGTFMNLFNDRADDIQRSSMYNQRLNIHLNENTGRLDYTDPRANSRLRGQRSTGQGFEPIDEFNAGLGVLSHVYKLDGEKVDANTLTRMGLDLNKKYETPWINQMMDAFKTSVKADNTTPQLFSGTPRNRSNGSGEDNIIPTVAKLNQGPPVTLDTPPATMVDEVFSQIVDQGVNEPLQAEGQRRLRQGFPQPRR